jgi:hypothetical protein
MATILLSNGKMLADVIDPKNEYSERTYENSSWEDYNCLSFAFQKWGIWYHPCATDDQFECFYDHYSLESGEVNTEDEIYYTFEEISNCKIDAKKTFAAYNYRYNDYENGTDAYTAIAIKHDYHTKTAMKMCTDNIINAFSGVRVISDISEAKEDEYVVAMAGGYFDFHFGVYIPTLNAYCHKMGGMRPAIVNSFDEVFGSRYFSERTYFAVKGNFEHVYEMVEIDIEDALASIDEGITFFSL